MHFLVVALCVAQPSWETLTEKVPADPPPKETTRGSHYVRSDEARHDLFRKRIAGKGGLFLGVGTNQNYMMGAWAEASHLIIVDFDEIIIHVHDAYRAFFLHAETPEELLELWKPRRANRKRAYQIINETYDSRRRKADARLAVKKFSRRVYWALKASIKEMDAQGVKFFLTDQAQYDHIRGLFQENRVFYIRGDFTARRTMSGISRMLEELEMPVSVLYLSNVEQYIGWNRGFRRNMERLPLEDDALVLRTYGWGRYRTADHNYRYYVQSGAAFKGWLGVPKRYVRDFLKSEEKTDIVGYHEMIAGPNGERFELAELANASAVQSEGETQGAIDQEASR